MEQVEEKIENIHRKSSKRRKSSSLPTTASSLPLDLILDIFLRLPAKYVARFRCVSKLWSSITTDPYFINSFKTRPNLLLFFKVGVRFFVFSLSQHNSNPNSSYSSSSSQPIDSYHMTYPKYCSFTIKNESVHGLICLQKAATPIVWNPTKKKFLTLPKPDKSWKSITVFLGYDPIEGKHKVVCMPYDYKAYAECRVLTLGSAQESWRTVKTNYKHKPFTGNRTEGYGYCTCINGVLYYRAEIGYDRIIMSFNVRSEKFNAMTLPWENKYWPVMMISYEGRLVCVGSTENSVSFWVLKDANKLERLNHILLPISHYGQGLKNSFKLIGISGDGELIYVPRTVLKSLLHIIYINPMTKTFRRVEYSGIADYDFRQRNGLEKDLCVGSNTSPITLKPSCLDNDTFFM